MTETVDPYFYCLNHSPLIKESSELLTYHRSYLMSPLVSQFAFSTPYSVLTQS